MNFILHSRNRVYDDQMKFREPWGLKLSDICHTGEEKPLQKPHPENLSRPGIELEPAVWHSTFYCPWSSAHSPTLLSLQLILQPFCRITYITDYSPTLPLLYLRHSSSSNPSIASPTSQFILQPFFPSLHLHHNSFSNPSVTLPTSQLILQPFHCFTYVTVHSPTFLLLLLRHKLFT